jgi:hypothetical protein
MRGAERGQCDSFDLAIRLSCDDPAITPPLVREMTATARIDCARLALCSSSSSSDQSRKHRARQHQYVEHSTSLRFSVSLLTSHTVRVPDGRDGS